ncbi:MFS transporter [Streptomyces sp. NPDC001268]|uniref:MFS transporter n=1 Tax=Streptomyces sp. NPDC001268 TaxID=3364553 RepID=UPI0036CDA871
MTDREDEMGDDATGTAVRQPTLCGARRPRAARRSVALPGAGVFAIGTDMFVVAGPLGGIAHDLGVTVGSAGLAVTVFALTYATGAILLGPLVAAFPPHRVLVVSLAAFAVLNVPAALAPALPVLLAARLLGALAASAGVPAAAAAAAAAVPASHRGRALGTIVGCMSAATVLGAPAGVLLASTLSWRAAFALPAVLAAATVTGLLLTRDDPHPPATPAGERPPSAGEPQRARTAGHRDGPQPLPPRRPASPPRPSLRSRALLRPRLFPMDRLFLRYRLLLPGPPCPRGRPLRPDRGDARDGGGAPVPGGRAGSWKRFRPLASPAVAATLAVTFLLMTASYSMYTFLPLLLAGAAAPLGSGLFIAVFGLAGMAGTRWGGSAADRHGPRRVVGPAVAVSAAAFAALPHTTSTAAGAAVVVAGWGAAVWGFVPAQQHRLLGLGTAAPALLLALHSGAVHLGAAAGSLLGGLVVDGAGARWLWTLAVVCCGGAWAVHTVLAGKENSS